MAGLYIHIPFCKKACTYCDFHFSTSLAKKDEMVHAIIQEIKLQKDYLSQKKLSSIYFGGGTPSLLNPIELDSIFEAIDKVFDIGTKAEITLEANPDDLSLGKLDELNQSPVNRLSIGVQSFDNKLLTLMNRSHQAKQAIDSVKLAQDKGLENITIDMIYGLPGQGTVDWEQELSRAVALETPHISSYALTVEPKTVLYHQVKKGTVVLPSESELEEQFKLLQSVLGNNGFEQYEVSNFAKKGFRAKHNSSYWSAESYLGIGPSSHSFNGTSRQWNVSNNPIYIKSLSQNKVPCEVEFLELNDQFNELVMTALRKVEGIDLDNVKESLGSEFYDHLLEEAKPEIQSGRLILEDNKLYIPQSQRFFSDGIASSLFYI